MDINIITTNTQPIYVKCHKVCEIVFIIVEADASEFCNRTESKDWNCGLDQLEAELQLSTRGPHIEEIRTYGVRNPLGEKPPFYNCEVNDTNR